MQINNPTMFPCHSGVGVNKAMTFSTQGGKVFAGYQHVPASTGFVVDVPRLGRLTPVADWIRGKVVFAYLGILIILTLALGRCAPQPAFALEWF